MTAFGCGSERGNGCHDLEILIKQDIEDLDYDEAKTALQELKKHIAAAEIILSESERTPIVTFRSESRTEDQQPRIRDCLPSQIVWPPTKSENRKPTSTWQMTNFRS
jgi:hypothetical protein